ncbi:hypothetical protein ACET3Z_021603 [Daucus carota]
MLSVSPSMIARSSMEEMLDSLRRREEVDRPRDLPPKLPSRPVSKARRPSSKRPLPNDFENSSAAVSCVKKDSRGGSFDAKKDGTLEEARKQVLIGTLKVQKCFRSYQDRRYFLELKRGVISLQSFVRAANARRKYDCLINQRELVVQKTNEQERIVLQLQAVIRGWLARKQAKILQNLEKLDQCNPGSVHSPSRRKSDVKEMPQVSKKALPLSVEELQKRVLKAEMNLEKKEQENAALRNQVQQYEARWLEYEGKMKLMEDMWQKQTSSLQMSLAAVKRSLSNNTSNQSRRQEDLTEFGAVRQSNGNGNPVCHLMKEFEQRKHTFNDEVKAIVESGNSAYADPDKDLRNLKNKFETWMKDYKARLREAKVKLHKIGVSDAEAGHRKWWRGMSKRH